MNNISPLRLATILWTVFFAFLYILYFAVFYCFQNSMLRWNTATRKKAPKNSGGGTAKKGGLSTQDAAANEEGATARIDDIYDNEYEFTADSYSNSTLVTNPIYKLEDNSAVDFSYVCLRDDTTYNVSFSKDMISYFALTSYKWGVTLSAGKNSVVSSTENIKTLAYDDDARGYVHSVSLQAFSNMVLNFKWERFSLPEEILIARELTWFLYTYYLPYIVTLISSAAMILVFYVPAYSEQNALIPVNPMKSKSLVVSIFALIVILFPSQITLLYNISTKSSCKNNMSILIITCSVLYFLAFGIISYLYSLTVEDISNSDSTTPNVSFYNQFQSYSCNCKGDIQNYTPKTDTQPQYSFTCPAPNATAIMTGDICNKDCNVCADRFFIPFVIFGLLLAAYVCLITFVTFFHGLIRSIFEISKIKVPPYKRYANVCLHGDVSHGFPLFMRMSIEDSKQLSNLLNEYKKGSAPFYQKHPSNILYRSMLYGNWAPGAIRPLRFTLSVWNWTLRRFDILNKIKLHSADK